MGFGIGGRGVDGGAELPGGDACGEGEEAKEDAGELKPKDAGEFGDGTPDGFAEAAAATGDTGGGGADPVDGACGACGYVARRGLGGCPRSWRWGLCVGWRQGRMREVQRCEWSWMDWGLRQRRPR